MNLSGSSTGVLGAVLERLQAADVRRRRHFRGEADRRHRRIGEQLCASGTPPQLCLQRGHQAPIGQNRRKDPARQVAQIRQRFTQLLADCNQQFNRLSWITLDQFLGDANVDCDRNQLLLGTVMDISLQATSRRVLSRHDALARGPQFLRQLARQALALLQHGGVLCPLEQARILNRLDRCPRPPRPRRPDQDSRGA
jgi:hypothetical protein